MLTLIFILWNPGRRFRNANILQEPALINMREYYCTKHATELQLRHKCNQMQLKISSLAVFLSILDCKVVSYYLRSNLMDHSFRFIRFENMTTNSFLY